MDKLGIIKRHGKKVWNFFWYEDSASSWVANIIVAFLVIRYLVYPSLGLILGTNYPIVAVVSESMEHGLHNNILCGEKLENHPESFDNYWKICGKWYEERGITKSEFSKFPLKNGFNKGDVIILWRANSDNTEAGDVLIFVGDKPQPIIHRVVKKWQEEEQYFYQTKGDHNSNSIQGQFGETIITENRILGKGVLRIPYLGWIKILFVDAVRPLGINIQR